VLGGKLKIGVRPNWAEDPSCSVRRIVLDAGPESRPSGAARPAGMSLRSGRDESDLDQAYRQTSTFCPHFIARFQMCPRDKMWTLLYQISPLKYDDVVSALLESEEVGAPPTGIPQCRSLLDQP
jgi:hypothetical protein